MYQFLSSREDIPMQYSYATTPSSDALSAFEHDFQIQRSSSTHNSMLYT